MTAVLVNGVPDTPVLWDGVRAHLAARDVRALALPGFGAPVPEGFDASKEAYVDWIISQLETMDGPVDLVGHDWGCMLTARVAGLRPDLVRTWAGGGGPIDPTYEWHAWAKIWQTPGEGEQWMADLDPEEFAATLETFDVPAPAARHTATHMDATMKDCILRLYRSAVDVGAEWEAGLAEIQAPSLLFWGASDAGVPIVVGEHMAAAIPGARLVRLDSNHWSPAQQPEAIAKALDQHWAAAG